MRRGPIVLGLALLLGGCVIPNMRPTVNSLNELGDGQAVVVGKLMMDPPFTDREKDMSARNTIVIGEGRLKRNLWVLVGPGKYAGDGEPEAGDYNGAIETPWDSTFYSRFHSGKNVLQLAAVAMTLNTKAYFPLNLKLDVRPEDEVVYIGTIRLRRDDYNNPKGMQVTDDLDSTEKAILKKFGHKTKIRKALAKPL